MLMVILYANIVNFGTCVVLVSGGENMQFSETKLGCNLVTKKRHII